MNKALIVILVLAVVAAIVLFIPSWGENDKIATECLRGSETACALFQAQENVTAAENLLQEAKSSLQAAREAYEASQGGE